MRRVRPYSCRALRSRSPMTGDIAAGKSKSVTLTLKPGHYALICMVS